MPLRQWEEVQKMLLEEQERKRLNHERTRVSPVQRQDIGPEKRVWQETTGMKRFRFLGHVVLISLWANVSVADASGPVAGWRGVEVLPKENCKVVLDGKEIDVPIIPFVVQAVNGPWLWVGNDKKGWVKRSQVLTLDEAPAYYSCWLKRHPRSAWAYGCRAIAWHHKGKLDLAITDYGAELRLRPNAIAYNNRGTVWAKKGTELDQAIADFDAAIRLNPSYALAYDNRGLCWYLKGKFEKAIADYGQALEFDPTSVLASSNRGEAMWIVGDFDASAKDFAEASRKDPVSPNANYNLGVSQHLIGDSEAAIARLEKGAMYSGSTSYASFFGPGQIRRRFKPSQDQPFRLDSIRVLCWDALAWILATSPDDSLRDGKRAVELASKAVSETKSNDGYYLDTLAAANAEAGDCDSAVNNQQKAIDLNKSDVDFVDGAEKRLDLYRDKKPYRQSPKGS
jgi:tetratricopeptide (TPR) repeat protein